MEVVNSVTGQPVQKLPPKLQASRTLLEELFKPVLEELKLYKIPDGMEQLVVDNAIKLLIAHPTWKPAKIVRKTAEYYNLKKF